MKGNPLLRLALVALGIGLLGVPVWSVTRGREAPPVMIASPADEEVGDLDLVIESSAPCRVEITLANAQFFSEDVNSAAVKTTVQIPKAGADLVVRATASQSGQRFAVRVRAGHDGSDVADTSFWGDGALAGVLVVPPNGKAR